MPILKKIAVVIVILIILIVALIFLSNQSITAYVPADFKAQQLNMVIDKSQSFILTTNNQEPYTLTSLRVSGEITGNGLAEIYLADITGQTILIYRNINKKTSGMEAITGMAVVGKSSSYTKGELDKLLLIIPDKELKETPVRLLAGDEEIKSGIFSNACKDSCFMAMQMSKNNKYHLVVKVEPGTVLKITGIGYTTQEN